MTLFNKCLRQLRLLAWFGSAHHGTLEDLIERWSSGAETKYEENFGGICRRFNFCLSTKFLVEPNLRMLGGVKLFYSCFEGWVLCAEIIYVGRDKASSMLCVPNMIFASFCPIRY